MVVPNLVTGVSVMFLKDDGTSDFSIHGAAAAFTTIDSKDASIGSAQWLSQVYVTETHTRLVELQAVYPPIKEAVKGTSGSSPHVTLFTDLDERSGRGSKPIPEQYVIALGDDITEYDGTKARLAHTLIVAPKMFSGSWLEVWKENIIAVKQFAKSR